LLCLPPFPSAALALSCSQQWCCHPRFSPIPPRAHNPCLWRCSSEQPAQAKPSTSPTATWVDPRRFRTNLDFEACHQAWWFPKRLASAPSQSQCRHRDHRPGPAGTALRFFGNRHRQLVLKFFVRHPDRRPSHLALRALGCGFNQPFVTGRHHLRAHSTDRWAVVGKRVIDLAHGSRPEIGGSSPVASPRSRP